MSEPPILICGPGFDLEDSERSLERIAPISLPNVTKYVITTGKFDTRGIAKGFNVEGNYPSEPTSLATLSAWAGQRVAQDPRARDGFDLFSLRSLLKKNKGFDFVILLRDEAEFEERWPQLQAEVSEGLFLTFGGRPGHSDNAAQRNVLFNVQDKWTSALLDLAWELYASGAVYAISPYSLEGALTTAMDALSIEIDWNNLKSDID